MFSSRRAVDIDIRRPTACHGMGCFVAESALRGSFAEWGADLQQREELAAQSADDLGRRRHKLHVEPEAAGPVLLGRAGDRLRSSLDVVPRKEAILDAPDHLIAAQSSLGVDPRLPTATARAQSEGRLHSLRNAQARVRLVLRQTLGEPIRGRIVALAQSSGEGAQRGDGVDRAHSAQPRSVRWVRIHS